MLHEDGFKPDWVAHVPAAPGAEEFEALSTESLFAGSETERRVLADGSFLYFGRRGRVTRCADMPSKNRV